jgi:hypothetical protein
MKNAIAMILLDVIGIAIALAVLIWRNRPAAKPPASHPAPFEDLQ